MIPRNEITQSDAGAMLACIPADDRETWIKCGMAVKSALGDAGFTAWDTWSQTADNYQARAARDVWRSFSDGGIGPGTLVHLAREYGWRPGESQHAPIGATSQPITSANLQNNSRAPTYPKALQIWQAATWEDGYTAAHPYAIRKGIKHAAGVARSTATGKLIGRDADCLIVPMRTLEGELTGVECVNPEGVKQTFGNKGILILGNDLDATLPQLIVEGWATAAAILSLYGWNACVYACFGKGMLAKLAGQVAGRSPDRQVIIAGESDA